MSNVPAIQDLPPMTRELVQSTPVGAIVPENLESVITLAKTLHASMLFPDLKNAHQAVAKILAGAELGLAPIASLNAFHIVQGKIMMHYSAIALGIRRAGYDYRTLEHSDEACTIAFLGRQGEVIGEFTFTVDDAKRAATQNMAKFPRTMLFARCLSQGARFFVPEAFNGMVVYAREEIDLIDPEPPQEPEEGTSQRVARRIAGDVPDEYDPFPVQTPVDPLALVASDFALSEVAKTKLFEWAPDEAHARLVLGTVEDASAAIEAAKTWEDVGK